MCLLCARDYMKCFTYFIAFVSQNVRQVYPHFIHQETEANRTRYIAAKYWLGRSFHALVLSLTWNCEPLCSTLPAFLAGRQSFHPSLNWVSSHKHRLGSPFLLLDQIFYCKGQISGHVTSGLLYASLMLSVVGAVSMPGNI